MSLKEIREKNKLKESIIYAQREGDIHLEVAQSIKDDVFYWVCRATRGRNFRSFLSVRRR